MKDAAKLFAYLTATLVGGALLAPPIYWAIQNAAAHGHWRGLAHYGFESVFHRALLIWALLLLWPLLKALHLRSIRELQLRPNPHPAQDFLAGFILSAVPLALAAVSLVVGKIFLLKAQWPWLALVGVLGAAVAVPLLEEFFFRGIILGVLLRDLPAIVAGGIVAAFYAIVHFLKAPERTNELVTWHSGFTSIAHSFAQFSDPLLLLAGFTTLFLVGCILADSRLRTHSLWLPIGLHSGWIFVSAGFGKVTKRVAMILPWLGPNLLFGLIPLALGLLTWLLVRLWLRRFRERLA